jgi:hypothetical protein
LRTIVKERTRKLLPPPQPRHLVPPFKISGQPSSSEQTL